MICQNCGCSNTAGNKYCEACGSKLEFVKTEEEVVFETEDQVVTENVSGEESIYRQVIENMKNVYTDDEYTENTNYQYEKYKEYRGNTFGIIATVFGALAIVACCCCTCVNDIFAIVAVILGIVSLVRREDNKALGIIGISLGGLVLLISCGSQLSQHITSSIGNVSGYNGSYNSNLGNTIRDTIEDEIVDVIGDIMQNY